MAKEPEAKSVEGELPSHMVPYPTGSPPDQTSINPEQPEPPKTPPPAGAAPEGASRKAEPKEEHKGRK